LLPLVSLAAKNSSAPLPRGSFFRSALRFVDDSPLEGDGFEPSVPER
jgi:hypothetical protein